MTAPLVPPVTLVTRPCTRSGHCCCGRSIVAIAATACAAVCLALA